MGHEQRERVGWSSKERRCRRNIPLLHRRAGATAFSGQKRGLQGFAVQANGGIRIDPLCSTEFIDYFLFVCLKLFFKNGYRIMNSVIKYFTEKQKTLLLIDSLGAFTTAFFLFAIMRRFNEYFGMPKTVLTGLSAAAGCFFIYSAFCFLFLKGSWAPFIRIIGIANLLYCSLTVGLLMKYYHALTIFGTVYFLTETVIICGLSYIELNSAKEVKKNSSVDCEKWRGQ